ncbi:hypothetical protein, partial [Klebsiella pneumoniae]|uniref:hypothetical protein n=1 Tax=Klebsiella pneumoniae TaxID=573 RepID=UPI0013D7FFB7
ATQPALRKVDGAIVDRQKRPIGFDIGDDRELAPKPRELSEQLKRVEIVCHAEPVTNATIAARFAEQSQMLC